MPLIWYRGGTVARNACMDLEVGQRGFCKIFTLISSFMRDEKAKLKELSNNISDRSEAKGTGIMSDLLVVDGESQTLVANPHYTILLARNLILLELSVDNMSLSADLVAESNHICAQ